MNKKIAGSLAFASLILPEIALASEEGAEKEMLHVFVETGWGPIGAVAGIMAMVIFWQLSRKVDKNFSYLLKMLTAALLCFNVAAVSFGFHGAGLLGEGTTVEITSTFRMIGLIIIDIAAIVMLSKLQKKEVDSQQNDTKNSQQ